MIYIICKLEGEHKKVFCAWMVAAILLNAYAAPHRGYDCCDSLTEITAFYSTNIVRLTSERLWSEYIKWIHEQENVFC